MAPEIVPITEAEMPALHRVCSTTFGEESTPEMVADELLVTEYDRMIGVADGGRLVASAGAYSFDLTVPGGATMPVAGVTWVGVLPTHRRQGVLRQMMTHQLDDVVERGEPVAILTASEAVIYGRFGYGVASQHVRAAVRTRDSSFVSETADPGSIQLAWSGDEGIAKVLADVYEQSRLSRAGGLTRNDGYWAVVTGDSSYRRNGNGPLYYALHEDSSGSIDGYLMYRVKEGDNDGDNIAYANELVAADPAVQAALWRYVFDLDLTKKVIIRGLPVDDPLKWRLTNSRAMSVEHLEDWLWARILDVPAALSTRTYAAEGEVVFAVHDPFRPDGAAAGTFRLTAGTDGASCVPAPGAEASVSLSVEALGSAWLGAVPFRTLAAAGRVHATPEALANADRMFAVTPAPYCNTPF